MKHRRPSWKRPLVLGMLAAALALVPTLSADPVITTVAGNGTPDYSGDGGPAALASLEDPLGIAVDPAGNLYIAAEHNNRIRRVSPTGVITTVAGTGMVGFSGDGGPATAAQLYLPTGVAVDGAGNLYVVDKGNHRIRKVSVSGVITTVAGSGAPGFAGDGGPAVAARLDNPFGITVDAAGNLYIGEWNNSRIRKVSPSGTITTVAGNGRWEYGGDGGPATAASINGPCGLAVDAAGNLYFADNGNNRVRKVSASGVITTVAGNGTGGYSGDGGPATSAQLWGPVGVALGAAGQVYIVDQLNNRVRVVNAAGIITTIAGNGTGGYGGDGGPAASSQLNKPWGAAVDSSGSLYIADGGNQRIRKVR